MTELAPPARRHAAAPPAVFAVATVGPGLLLLAAAARGGLWAAAALVSVTLLVALLDRLTPPDPVGQPAAEFPAAPRLLAALGLLQLVLIPAVLWAVAGASGHGAAARAALFAAAGLYLGQVGHAAAHELIHRGERGLFALGAAVYAALGFGHHVSAHRLVHHRFVATPADPNSAAAGEGFWAWALRAWAGSFRAGAAAETALRARAKATGGVRGPHPYLWWVGGGALVLTAAGAALGPWGLAACLALWGHAQMQILLSDYIQHYGLRRRILPDGRFEPPGPAHAWEARAAASGAMLLHAGRHADHHAHPGRPFPDLVHDAAAPRLPYGMPVMGAIALVPPLWRRMMDPRLARLRHGGAGS